MTRRPALVAPMLALRPNLARSAAVAVAALALALVGVAATPPRSGGEAALLARAARVRYDRAQGELEGEIAASLEALEKDAQAAPDGSPETLRAIEHGRRAWRDSGAFPELPQAERWRTRWRDARAAYLNDLEKALAVAAKSGASNAEWRNLDADRAFFLRVADRAPWREIEQAPMRGTGDGAWIELPPADGEPRRWVSCVTSTVTTTQPHALSFVPAVDESAPAYELALSLRRVAGDEGCTLEFLDGARRVVRCELASSTFSAGAKASLAVRVRVFESDSRVEIDGAVVHRAVEKRDAAAAPKEAIAHGVVRVRPSRLARFEIANPRWKPLRACGEDGEPRASAAAAPSSAPGGLTETERAALARARLAYARSLREITEATARALRDRIGALEKRAAAGELPELEHATLDRCRRELEAYEAEGEWPSLDTSDRRTRWFEARETLAGAYARALTTLGRSPEALAARASLERDLETTKAARDLMPWRAFERASIDGVGEATTTKWIARDDAYTSPRSVERSERDALAAYDGLRATLSFGVELPLREQEYAVELELERLGGDGGCTLVFPDGANRPREAHLGPEVLGKGKPREVFLVVFDRTVRVDVDGVTVFPEQRSARGEAPARSVAPIAIQITPDERTQLRVRRPRWKSLTPVRPRREKR